MKVDREKKSGACWIRYFFNDNIHTNDFSILVMIIMVGVAMACFVVQCMHVLDKYFLLHNQSVMMKSERETE